MRYWRSLEGAPQGDRASQPATAFWLSSPTTLIYASMDVR